MQHIALAAGQAFPQISVNAVNGGEISLGTPGSGFKWQLVVVYRGAHCPLCTRYLQQLNDRLEDWYRADIDVVAVSADPLEKAQSQLAEVQPQFPVM